VDIGGVYTNKPSLLGSGSGSASEWSKFTSILWQIQVWKARDSLILFRNLKWFYVCYLYFISFRYVPEIAVVETVRYFRIKWKHSQLPSLIYNLSIRNIISVCNTG
jgi:hypothetical protein